VIVLDTNVVASLMRREANIVGWLDAQPAQSIWTTSVSVYETRFGIEILAKGRRRRELGDAFDRLLRDALEGRILSFDRAAAFESSTIAAGRRAAGRPIEIRDVQIAGITAANSATLATRNVRHFQDIGLSIVDPWSE
jgi:toxin FitB